MDIEAERIIDHFLDSVMENLIAFLVKTRELNHRSKSLPPPSYSGTLAITNGDTCQRCSYLLSEINDLKDEIEDLKDEITNLRLA